MNAQKNLEIREGRQEQWNSTSTPWIFFFLSREVSYIHSERFLTFIFFMLCSYFQNNECKNLEIREGRQEQWNPTSTPGIFFSLTRFFLYTFRKIPYNFSLCPVRISRKMNAKKSRNSRGRQKEWNPTCTTWYFFFFHENFHTYYRSTYM